MLIKMLKAGTTAKTNKNEKSIYLNYLTTVGCAKYKSSVLLSLHNNCRYKKISNINQLNSDYTKSLIKFITFHFGTIKKESIILDNKKRSLFAPIKTNK